MRGDISCALAVLCPDSINANSEVSTVERSVGTRLDLVLLLLAFHDERTITQWVNMP